MAQNELNYQTLHNRHDVNTKISDRNVKGGVDYQSSAVSSADSSNPTQTNTHQHIPAKVKDLQLKCIKNVILIGVAGFCSHIISEVIAALASSLGTDVVRAMTVKSYCVVVGCYLAPLVIKIIGAKYSIILGPFIASCFIAVFLYPQFYLLLSVSIIYGLLIGVFYVAALFHMMDCTFIYANLTSVSIQKASSFSNAYLWVMFSLSGLTGNLINSLHFHHYKNSTMPNEMFYDVCGNNFCPEYASNSSIIKPPTKDSLNVLVYILIVLAMIGFSVTFIFMETLKNEEMIAKDQDQRQIWRQLLSVLYLFSDIKVLLLIPIIITHGMVQMFPDVDYTQAYVTCMLGVQNVGFVMVCTTGCSTVGSFISGSIGSVIKPQYIIVGAFCGLASIMITLLAWNIPHDMPSMVYVIAAMIGLGDGIARTQLSAYLIVLLKDKSDAAASAYFMLNILGHCFIFTWDILICMEVKLSLLLALIIVSAVLFVIVDMIGCRGESEEMIALRENATTNDLQFQKVVKE